MSRKRCKRKVWPLIDPIAHAMKGAAVTDAASLDRLRLIELAALDALATRHATKADFRIMADMLNVSEQLALAGVGPEALAVNLEAQQGLREADARGDLVLTEPQLQALRHAYEYADLQRSSISRAELERVITKTAAKVRQAQAEQK